MIDDSANVKVNVNSVNVDDKSIILLQTELSATSMEVAAACVAGTAGLAAVYRVARPYFSVRVNCHFCNNNYKVSGELTVVPRSAD